MKNSFVTKEWTAYLLLFFLSSGIYLFYFQQLAFNLNTVLFQAEGDSIKNYYTYAFHACNDAYRRDFSGMNYPFGEHVVYTDCQPLISSILSFLPFTHAYVIGIMHGLILLSFIITPLILYRIFIKVGVNRILGFLASIAIALLSPQTHRVGGHFALAYGCVIPLAILFLLNYFSKPGLKPMLVLFVYSICLFFVHPYFGLGVSAFSFFSIVLYECQVGIKPGFLKRFLMAAFVGAGPIISFKAFMNLTDIHNQRPAEPYGVDIMGAAGNPESVFTPSFGPFVHFLKRFIKAEKVEWETLSYIGVFPLTLLLLGLLILPFCFRKVRVQKELTAMFITAILLLLFAFGLHIQLMQLFDLKIKALNQFRVFGRFAWYFYFLLPVFLMALLSDQFTRLGSLTKRVAAAVTGLLFVFFNMLEAHYMFRDMTTDTFKARNIFNEQLLSREEKEVLELIKSKNIKILLPFPVFHIGSEMYQRNGDMSVKPAMMYSYHSGLPLLSVMMSRTSMGETEAALEILNRYKRNRQIEAFLKGKNILIIKTGNKLLKDELRVLEGMSPVKKTRENSFFVATLQNFVMQKAEERHFVVVPNRSDSARNIIFIPTAPHPPFISVKISDFATITTLDSNTFTSGDYTLSFHYKLIEKIFRYIHNNCIVVKSDGHSKVWEHYTAVRSACGFYGNFIVFEQRVRLDRHFSYEFMLNGATSEYYKISSFLLKPDTLDVQMVNDGLSLYNNYPN